MLRTIDRYVIREVIPPFLLSLLIFTFLLEIPPVMRYLETLVAKGVSWQVAGRILLLLMPQALGVTIPMALLTGLLIGLGRLSADRESVALLACGVSPYRLLRPVMAVALVATGATLYVLIEAIPNANVAFNRLVWQLITKHVEEDIRPRVFFESFPGWVLYPRAEAPGGGWQDVLVAQTRPQGPTRLFLAARGRLHLDPARQQVALVLEDGMQYDSGKPGQADLARFPGQLVLALDPKTVFPSMEMPLGIPEKTIAELRRTMDEKREKKMSLHPEIIGIQQKFSIPVACLVFALAGLALGLTSARGGKVGGFVIGIAVIFAYYAVMIPAESFTKGLYADDKGTGPYVFAYLARWLPNIVLGLFGIAAMVWRARFAERGLPISIPIGLPTLPTRWRTAGAPAPDATAATAPASAPAMTAPGVRPRKVVVVIRVPRLRVPGAVGILDQYISRLYLRVVGLSFFALLGLFYIASFIDRSDKLFKGQASGGALIEWLAFQTPQFVYYVIPIAALLSTLVTFGLLARTSELTVMKACGISLYRAAVPIVALSIGWSAVLFALEQEVLATANRRAEILDNQIRGLPTTTFNPLNRRWIIGRDGSIYHYNYFDAGRQAISGLSIYRLAGKEWRLASHTFTPEAGYAGASGEGADQWMAVSGWTQDLTTRPPAWSAFSNRRLEMEPPDYFYAEQPPSEMMTVNQLRADIADLEASGFNVIPQKVELHRKLAFPFVTFVMTLLAIPFGITTGRRGALYGIGIGIILALSYWVIFSVFIAIGRAGLLPPPLAAWTPNVIVIAAGIYLLLTART